jgi:HPt (histidine-containing phosphotransfer) domain-containing protein
MKLSINPALDLDYISRVYGDDANIISSIFNAFLIDCLPRWNSLGQLIEDKNKQEAASVVHGLKPAFTMAGLGEIKSKVVELEELILQGVEKEVLLKLYGEINEKMAVMVPILTEEAARLEQMG